MMVANVIPLHPKLNRYSNTSSYDDALELEVAVRNTETQQKQMLETLKQIEAMLAKQNPSTPSETWTIKPTRARNTYSIIDDFLIEDLIKGDKTDVISQHTREILENHYHLQTKTKSVPLHLLLEVGSVIAAAISIGSIAIWLSGHIPLLNPFASMLILIATPFFFSMGRITVDPSVKTIMHRV